MDPDEDPGMDPGKPSKEKKKSRKSKSESRKSSSRKSKKKSSSSKESEDYSDEGQWDPVKFDEQTGDCWKDIDKPKRVADLPSPDIADYERQEGDEDWPYKKSYAVDERKSKSKKEKGLTAPSRAKSDDEGEVVGKEKRSSKKDKKSKSKSKSSRSSSSRDHDDDAAAAEVSDEEEDLHSEEEDEARARRRPKKHSSRKSDSERSSGEGHDDDVSDGYDEGSNNNADSDEFSEDASFYSDEDEPYSSDLDGSIDSDGTYDSAEEYGDYGGMPPETPAMMNYNQEINDLMHKANPEHTDHLMNRVNRQKGNIAYDQNMPMMTRQALMTRQASAQAARARVDANSVDRSRLGFRNESFHGKSGGGAKPVRRGPGGKRAPPRSKSSGLGTMAMAGRRAAPSAGGEDAGGADDPRSRFRGRGASTSFQRHSNKPNNVARMSGRRGEMDRSGHRPAAGSSASRGEPRRGNVGRAKSTTALSRGAPSAPQKPLRRQPRRTTKEEQMKTNEVSDESSEEYDSDEESDSDEGQRSRPKRRVKKVVDKQDMTIKKHRRKLHGMMYNIKMSVEMSDLMKEVKKGEIPKSPIKTLLMDEP
ncbi:unnamed protein product [Cylindrotheca closterium]|uniref:Uncharacterized protein n=1 Tax=Cylindrotheca closterium TaxID=2856 RepID=A0AAD2FLU8_9STRA|nr:unnamed protein product [Cylindrotheca closterium]